MISDIQWINKISNLLSEDETGEIYRLVMLSIINVIEENSIIQDESYSEALAYAENYWFYFKGNDQQLEKYLNDTIELARKSKFNLTKNSDNKKDIITSIHRTILRKFDFSQIDETCDNLYWVIECMPLFGIKNSHIKSIFFRYFENLI